VIIYVKINTGFFVWDYFRNIKFHANGRKKHGKAAIVSALKLTKH